MRDKQHTNETQTGSETMSEKTQGSKYEAGRNVAETAKMIRKEIKATFSAKAGYKCSVRIERYSMGQSLDVEIKAVPFATICNPEYVKAFVAAPHDNISAVDFGGRYTREAASLKIQLEQIVDQYNRKDIDSQSDYYNVAFSSDVNFAHELTRAEWDKAEAEAK